MGQLQEKLLTPDRRPKLVTDCVRLVEEEVERKSGLTGLVIKGGFKVVKGVKPGFIESAVDHMLDAWVEKLENHYQKWLTAGSVGTFGAFCGKDAAAVADRLLEVTDERAKKVDNRAVGSAYEKLRPSAKDHVIQAVPGLGRVVDRHLA